MADLDFDELHKKITQLNDDDSPENDSADSVEEVAVNAAPSSNKELQQPDIPEIPEKPEAPKDDSESFAVKVNVNQSDQITKVKEPELDSGSESVAVRVERPESSTPPSRQDRIFIGSRAEEADLRRNIGAVKQPESEHDNSNQETAKTPEAESQPNSETLKTEVPDDINSTLNEEHTQDTGSEDMDELSLDELESTAESDTNEAPVVDNHDLIGEKNTEPVIDSPVDTSSAAMPADPESSAAIAASIDKKATKKKKNKKITLWDILFYVIVLILVAIIVYLVLILLDRYDQITLPDSLPLVGFIK